MLPKFKTSLKKPEPKKCDEIIETDLTFAQVKKLVDSGKKVEIKHPVDGFTKVTDSYVKNGPGYEIVFDDGSIVKCGKDHWFRVISSYTKIWRTAEEVNHNDLFAGVDGDYKRMVKKTPIPSQSWIDFSVAAEDESYLQNGIVHHNSGKSFSIYLLARWLIEHGNKVLLVVPSVSLVTQMYSDFMKYNWDLDEKPAMIYSGQDKNIDCFMTITTYQSIYKEPADWFDQFDAVLIDEAHQTTALSIKGILSKCRHSKYKLGFTGTLHEHETDVMSTVGYLGPVIYELKTKDLIEKGQVSNLTIVNTFVRYPDEEIEKNKHRNYQGEVDYINEERRRLGVLDTIIDVAAKKDENVLILCTNKEPMYVIEKYLNKKYGDSFSVQLYHGDVKADKREEIREGMENSKRSIIIGTYGSISTGVSIKRLHHVVFFSSYRSKIKVLQSIGRGLRLHETKSMMYVWDIVDDLSYVTRTGTTHYNHVMKHWVDDRMRYYKEQGFTTKKWVFKIESHFE